MVAGVAGEGPQAPSLDLGTKLVLTLYPSAGEALLCRPGSAPDAVERLREAGKPDSLAPLLTDEEWAARQAANHARATARARGELRRYIVANRLRLMFVLTRLGGCGLHGAEGRREVMRLTAAFVRALTAELGQGIPYAYSPELHPAGKQASRETCPDPDGCGCGGHGWHVNLFVGRALPVEMMKRLWQGVDPGNGYELRYKDWTRDSRVQGRPMVEKLRAGASYGSKYASKDWGEAVLEGGAHRYEVAQGYKPARVQVVVLDRQDAEDAIRAASGGPALPAWCSADFDSWDGPLCWGYRWTPRRRRPPPAAGGAEP